MAMVASMTGIHILTTGLGHLVMYSCRVDVILVTGASEKSLNCANYPATDVAECCRACSLQWIGLPKKRWMHGTRESLPSTGERTVTS